MYITKCFKISTRLVRKLFVPTQFINNKLFKIGKKDSDHIYLAFNTAKKHVPKIDNVIILDIQKIDV